MKSGPEVSVLLPVYGDEPYLFSALNSLAEQSFSDFEVVLVSEDVSDSTREVINKEIVPVKELEYNGSGGISGALNMGIKHCSGRFIARMDADDIALTHRLRAQVEYMNENPHVGVLGGAYTAIGSDGSFQAEVFPPKTHSAIHWRLLLTNCIPHPTVMIRKSILDSNNYRTKFNYAEDYDLWARLLNETKIHNLNYKLIKYRVSDKNNRYNQVQTERALSVSKRTIGEIPSVCFNKPEITDMYKFVTGGGDIQDRTETIDNLYTLFSCFTDNFTHTDEVSKEFTTQITRGMLYTSGNASDYGRLGQLFFINPKLPLHMLEMSRSPILRQMSRCQNWVH